MPLASETIVKNWGSHKQADKQAGKPGLRLSPLLYRHSVSVGPKERKQIPPQGACQTLICLENLSLENIIFSGFSLRGTAMLCIHSHKVSESLCSNNQAS